MCSGIVTYHQPHNHTVIHLHNTLFFVFTCSLMGFGGLVVSMLASGTQDHGFEPGRSRRIFRVKKSAAHLPLEGK
jgi:uncharacterized protein (DUF1786 family)